MLLRLKPGRPADPGVAALDLPIQPLLAAAANKAPLEPVIDAIVRELGYDGFSYAMYSDAQPQRDSRCYHWGTLHPDWLAHYERSGYVEIDPQLTQSYHRTAPYLWDQASCDTPGPVRRFLDDAARFGIRSGVAVSFSDPRHARIVVALASASSPVDAARTAMIGRNLGRIVLLATYFHDIFMARFVDGGATLRMLGSALSARRLECLRMAAHGMTSADISAKLGITERTVNFHFTKIITALGVLNRHEAIAKAMKLDLFRLSV